MRAGDGRNVRRNQNNSSTLTDRVFVAIRNDILAWKHSPNDVLVESKLATQYHVSKTPVREALALLSQQGWVEVLPHVGYRVTSIRVSDVEEIFEMRLLAEREAIRLATQRADEGQLQALLTRIQEVSTQVPEEEIGDPESFICDRDPLHLMIAALAGNQRLEQLIYQLLRDWTRMCLSAQEVREKAFGGEQENCRRLCEAMIRRDTETAQMLMQSHITHAKRLILSQMTLEKN